MMNISVSQVLRYMPLVIDIGIVIVVCYLLIRYHQKIGLALYTIVVELLKTMRAIIGTHKLSVADITTFIRDNIFTWNMFYWSAVIVCMLVSMQHGSYLFRGFEPQNQSNVLLKNFDILLVAMIDIAIVAFMRALTVAKRQGRIAASLGILFIIILFTGVTFSGNLAYNLHFMNAASFSGVDAGYQQFLPFLASSPPLIIIGLSVVTEFFVKSKKNEDEDDTDRIKVLQKREDDKVKALEIKLATKKRMRDIKQKYGKNTRVEVVEEQKDEQKLAIDMNAVRNVVVTEITNALERRSMPLIAKTGDEPVIMHMHNGNEQRENTSPIPVTGSDMYVVSERYKEITDMYEHGIKELPLFMLLQYGVDEDTLNQAVNHGGVYVDRETKQVRLSTFIKWVMQQTVQGE